MKVRGLALLLAAVLLLSLAACAAPGSGGANAAGNAADAVAPDAPAARLFTDDLGRDVEIPGEISAIVPSGPLAQMVLYAIAPECIVGLASKYYDSARGIIPQEHLDLPYFGQLYDSANLNVEQLAAAGPQLIVDIGQVMDGGREDLDDLQAATQIPSVFLAASLETMPETFRRLGELLNRQEKAEELASFCERVYSRTLGIMEQVGEDKVDALYILGQEGLNVIARDSYHSQLLDLLTDNVAVVENPSSKGSGNEVTLEQIALWDPEFIVFAPDSIYDTAAGLDVWQDLQAIRSGNYVRAPQAPHNWLGTPPAVQRYLGLIWFTAVLYPEYCDYDVKAEVLEYYRLFYSCQLSEERYEEIVSGAFLK